MLIPNRFNGYSADGLRRMNLDFGGDSPPPPDYTPVANASKEAAEIGAKVAQDQLAEARRQYDQNMATAKPVVDAQTEIMRQTAAQGKDYYEYGKTFRPLEQQMLTQVSGGLTARDMVRLGTSGVPMADALRTVNRMTPKSGSVGGASTMGQHYDGYFEQIPAGQTNNWGGGTIAKQQDGSAVYTRPDGSTYAFDQGTPMMKVAQDNPLVAQEWKRDYGYQAPMRPQQPDQPQGAPAEPGAPILRFATATPRRQPGARFARFGASAFL
jgi:hypothetical protein